MTGLKIWKEYPGKVSTFYKGASISTEVSPELLGVGYIIGPRIAGYLFAGGSLAYLVLIPAIKLFGSGLSQPIFAETKLIRDMSPAEVRAEFVFYIGAGAVASAGIIALLRALPTIVGAFRSGFQDLRGSLGDAATRLRTDVDLPIWITLAGAAVLAILLTVLPAVGVNFLGAILIIVFGFFFVVVSSRITGEIGVSANPISGMTIAALIGTTTIFLLIGWTGVDHRVGAISIAGVIAVAAGNAGATSQDLKTGFLVGATPKRQQIAIMVGAITSALAIGWTLTLLNTTYTNVVPESHPGVALQASPPGESGRSVTSLGERMQHEGKEWDVVRVNIPTQGIVPGKYLIDPGTREVAYLVDPGIGGRVREIAGKPITKLDSPKATIMALVTDGILTQKLPWGLVLIGVFLTVAIELMGLQSLPIAVGVYLPISTSLGDVCRGCGSLAGGAEDADQQSHPGRGGVGTRRTVLQWAHCRWCARRRCDRGNCRDIGRQSGGSSHSGGRLSGACRGTGTSSWSVWHQRPRRVRGIYRTGCSTLQRSEAVAWQREHPYRIPSAPGSFMVPWCSE